MNLTMKKGLIFIFVSILIFSACVYIAKPKDGKKSVSDKIKIVATLYPQYDFAKQIGGEKVEVSMLLTPGTETHTYEPTPQDIINVNDSDVFVYTGKYMEPWADRIISSVDSNTKVLDASQNTNMIKSEDDEEHDEHEEENHNHEHHHEYDPHIWLDPNNAVIMVENITNQLCSIDAENADYYKSNWETLISEIRQVDADIESLVNNSKNKKIAFGGTFAYAYFVNRYGLEYVTAYDSCGESAEPSVAKVKEVIDYMRENNIKVVFYQELSAGKIADSIASETGAKKLIFHTIHNASQDEINNGETYVSLMKKNLENLKIALQ